MTRRPPLIFAKLWILGVLVGCNPDNLEPDLPHDQGDPQIPVQSLSASSDTLTASADAILRSAPRNSNKGASDALQVKLTEGQDTTRAIVRFDQIAHRGRRQIGKDHGSFTGDRPSKESGDDPAVAARISCLRYASSLRRLSSPLL